MTNSSYFISDLHLSHSTPEIFHLFQVFMEKIVLKADELFILGDFFDAWIGDDFADPVTEQIIEILSTFSSQKPLYFMHGNRDFLVGEEFCQAIGAQLLPEYFTVERFNQRALLVHGDQLCTDDIAFMEFRQQSRTVKWKQAILSLSIEERIAKAQQLRLMSQESAKAKSLEIMDVNQQAVEQTLDQYDLNLMIHGHTHRPAFHQWEYDQKTYQRVVLSDWSSQKGNFLVWEGNQMCLQYFDRKAGIINKTCKDLLQI